MGAAFVHGQPSEKYRAHSQRIGFDAVVAADEGGCRMTAKKLKRERGIEKTVLGYTGAGD